MIDCIGEKTFTNGAGLFGTVDKMIEVAYVPDVNLVVVDLQMSF